MIIIEKHRYDYCKTLGVKSYSYNSVINEEERCFIRFGVQE